MYSGREDGLEARAVAYARSGQSKTVAHIIETLHLASPNDEGIEHQSRARKLQRIYNIQDDTFSTNYMSRDEHHAQAPSNVTSISLLRP